MRLKVKISKVLYCIDSISATAKRFELISIHLDSFGSFAQRSSGARAASVAATDDVDEHEEWARSAPSPPSKAVARKSLHQETEAHPVESPHFRVGKLSFKLSSSNFI